jgi:DNA-binding MarR family transcriptional regulator
MNETDAARVVELLEDVRRLFKEHVTRMGASPGLPLTTIAILREIGREPGLSVSALGRRTGLSKGYVSSVVDQMCADDLLEKKADTEDQRCVRIDLTGGGEELLARLDQRYRGFWAELLEDVAEADAAVIVEGLESLRVSLRPRAVAAPEGGR